MSVKIPLSQGLFAIVDDEDADEVAKYKWSALKLYSGFYAVRHPGRRGQRRLIYLHRYIVNPPNGMIVDHVNRNTLDNRRNNLRVCTYAENSLNSKTSKANKSGFRGVSWNQQGVWVAYIRVNGKSKHLGVFRQKEQAARAYNEAAKLLRGGFAVLNDI